jgi:hypothetical protein
MNLDVRGGKVCTDQSAGVRCTGADHEKQGGGMRSRQSTISVANIKAEALGSACCRLAYHRHLGAKRESQSVPHTL